MTATEERLYGLLPAFVRTRDVEQGEPLRALLGVLARQFGAVEADIDSLYDNWFIETCEEWVVPYIGDLLAARPLHAVSPRTSSARAVVANTLSYRRRKGTATMLEQLASDVTGWPARAVEFFELLATTQNVNHVRPGNLALTGVRDAGDLERLGGPFERAAHTVEVRSVRARGGRHDIPNVGLFLWRLQSYPLTGVTGRGVEPSDGRFRFDPLGLDAPLFNRARTEPDITHLAEEVDVPEPIRRRELHDAPAVYLAGDEPVVRVEVDGTVLAPEEIVICDLADRTADGATDWTRPAAGVAIDPERGRLAFAVGAAPGLVRVDYAYGFAGDLGGGPYDRGNSAAAALTRAPTWQLGVSADGPAAAGEVVATLTEAVDAWNAQRPGTRGVIAILDSRTYAESLTGAARIVVPGGSELLVVAADWPAENRTVGAFVASGTRPHLRGDIEVHGTASADEVPGRLVLNGLLIEGSVTAVPGDLGRLHVSHCTLAPGHGGLVVAAQSADGSNDRLELVVERSISAAITLDAPAPSLAVSDSIVHGDAGNAISAPATNVAVESSTMRGTTDARTLEASNSIFTDVVVAARRQVGCVRFSYLPSESQTPRRFRCQAELALAAGDGPAERLVPMFTSFELGHPGYGQLARASAVELRVGADDGSELGAFGFLKQPQREANLLAGLDEYLRFGLEAGLFYVT